MDPDEKLLKDVHELDRALVKPMFVFRMAYSELRIRPDGPRAAGCRKRAYNAAVKIVETTFKHMIDGES